MTDTGSTDPDQTLAKVTELARQALAAQANLAKRSIELGRATLAGELDQTSAGRAYLDAMGREGTRYWQEVGKLGLEYAGAVVSLGNRAAARVLTETRAAAAYGRSSGQRAGADRSAEPAPDAEGDDPGRPTQLTLRGAPGQTAQATVTVVNRHPRARRVELTPSGLVDQAGASVALELRVEPARVTIPAGGDHQITVEVDLASDVVTPGAGYTGTLTVSGGDEATVAVAVEVEA